MARKISLSVKLVTLVVALTVIPTCVVSYFATEHVQNLGDYALESNSALGETAANDSVAALLSLGESIIEQKAEGVALQLEIFIKAHPTMSVADLQQDDYFNKTLAVQKVGDTGYTAVTDVESLVCRFHKSWNITNFDLHNLSTSLPGFWSIMSMSEGGVSSAGYYDWQEPDTSIREKYMYIAIVNATTADDVTFSVAATTYIDEFSSPALETRDTIINATQATNHYLIDERSKLVNRLVFVILLMIAVVVICSVGFAKSIIRPIYNLKETTDRINETNLDEPVEILTNDEIGDLAKSFDNMRISLKSSYEDLEKKVEDRTEQIRESERRMADIINFLPDSTFVIDSNGKVIAWNKAIEEMTGVKASDMVGKGEYEYALPFYGERRPIVVNLAMMPDDEIETNYQKVRRQGDALLAEIFAKSLGKEGRYVFAAASALRNSKGEIVGAIEIVRDITEQKFADDALKESEKKYRQLYENLRDGMAVVDMNRTIIEFNPAFQKMLGYDSEEIYKLTYEDITPKQWHAVESRIISEQVMKRGYSEIFEKEYIGKGGKIFPVELRIYMNRDKKGAPTSMWAVVRDITDRRKAEEAIALGELQFRTIFERTNDVIYINGLDGSILDANAAACEELGYTMDELRKMNAKDVDTPEQAAFIGERIEAMNKNGKARFESVHRRKDGSTFPVDVSCSIMDYKDNKAIISICRDMTERKKVEEEILKAKGIAEAATQAKSEFLANMSHEIRTPMNGIIGMVDLTLDTELTAEQKEYLELAKSSAKSLLTLINDILDFSKIEANKMELEFLDFDLHEAMDQTMRVMGIEADKKGVELVYEIDRKIEYTIKGDQTRLQQLLTNLVKNAIKFTEKGHIYVKAVEEDGSTPDRKKLHFSVQDTGIGIPDNKLNSIFEPFIQADGTTTRKYGGTGLGLSITKHIVEMMNGKIWVESKLDDGSTFHIALSFQTGKPIESHPVNPEDLKGLEVLIVDDNPINRLILRRNMVAWGMEVTEASCGKECLGKIQESLKAGRQYQLMLLDCMMPDIDGFEVVSKLKEINLQDIIIIMLSSLDHKGNKQRSKELGISEYLVKPVSQSALMDSVMNILSKKKRASASVPKVITRAQDTPVRIPDNTRILLAEDNQVNRKLAVRLLEKAGLKPSTAANGLEVLQALENSDFDMILMDVQMPEMDGIEATKKIREAEAITGRHISIIALTAHAMKGDRERFLEAGMDDYLSKPLNPKELYELVAKYAKNARS